MTVYEPDPDQLKKLLILSQDEFGKARLAIKVYSELLDCDIYLVSHPSLADKVDGIAYLPEEIQKLCEIRDSLKPHYEERLRKIHEAKKIFKGKIVDQ